MPKAKPPIAPKAPAPISAEEAQFILNVVRRYFGDNAVVRNWGPDPKRLSLHVEADQDIGLRCHECLGELMCVINRDQISLDITPRGGRVRGNAKLAYRQGVVLREVDT